MWSSLLEYKRNGVTEVVLHGSLSWVTEGKEIYSLGSKEPFYGRSLMKPVQMKTVAKELDKILTLEEKSFTLASHNGETCHLEILDQILSKKDRLSLQIPPSLPLLKLGRNIKKREKSYHPCSGKHAGILKACEESGWDKLSYTSTNHEYHKAYLEKIKSYLGKNYSPLHTAKDGCSLPTVSFTLKDMAQIFSSFAQEKDSDWIWEAMIKNPKIVGGTKRLDTNILSSCKGKVIAKEGADGLLGLSICHPKYPKGLGVVIKFAHGWDPKAMSFIASKILDSLGFKITPSKPPIGQTVFVNPNIVPG